MEEELWSALDNIRNEVILTKKGDGTFRLVLDTWTTTEITLDRKHLKDLFNAIGNELNAFPKLL